MLVKLGRELGDARGRRRLSLQAVAEPANISAAYLQKLERGVVDTPSPRVLGRLAAVLGVPYLGLMQLAGYLDDGQRAEAQLRLGKEPHPLAGQVLSPAEWRAVGSFIDELKARRRATKRRDAR